MSAIKEEEKKGAMKPKAADNPEPSEDKMPKIMTKPLPAILDELENYIGRVEDAVKQAQEAARNSREAAVEARSHGETAAASAKQAAEAAVARIEKEAAITSAALAVKIADIESGLDELKEMMNREALALDNAFAALRDSHTEESPFKVKQRGK